MCVIIYALCVSRLLQLSRLELDALLKRRNVDDHAYDVEDLEQDLKTLADFAGRISSVDAQEMREIVQREFERVDPSE